jgi:phosphodiesterase/alkaline phosphatase D-like protein
MVKQPMLRGTLVAAGAVLAIFFATPASPLAATAFSGVAAGDMASNDAILWTRAFNG